MTGNTSNWYCKGCDTNHRDTMIKVTVGDNFYCEKEYLGLHHKRFQLLPLIKTPNKETVKVIEECRKGAREFEEVLLKVTGLKRNNAFTAVSTATTSSQV